MRWWDGSTWTQDRTAAAVEMAPGNNLRDVGDWLSITFRIVKERAGHLFTLVVVLSLPVGLIVSFAMWQIFKELSFTVDANADVFEFTGPSPGLWVLAGVVLIGAFVLSMALYAAMQRQAMAALLERPEPWSKSLSEGLAKAPKLLANYLLLVVALVVVVVLIALLGVLNGGLGVLGILGFLGLGIWGIGRLFMFVPAASCSPSGTSTIKTTFGLSKGYTAPLIGRALLIGLIFIGIGIAGSLVTAPLNQGIVGPLDADTTTFNFADFIGDNFPQFALAQVITTLINGIGIAITAAATSIVYKDRGGPIDPALGLDPAEDNFGQTASP